MPFTTGGPNTHLQDGVKGLVDWAVLLGMELLPYISLLSP